VQHTNEVLEHVAGLRLAMESVESGYRDFGLSGNDAYLRLSDSGKLRVGEELRILKEVTTDNAGQQFRLVGITDLARRIILQGDTLAREAAAKGRGLPAEGVPAGKDDPLLEEFRIAARDLENEERRLLRGRSANGERRYRESKLALIVGGVLAVLIAAISGWMVPRDYSERKEAANKLRRLNRLYAMVSAINALGIRVRDRDDLFSNACRIAVEHGEFEMAWIGVVVDGAAKIVPMAWSGANDKTRAAIETLFASSAGTVQGKTLAARATRFTALPESACSGDGWPCKSSPSRLSSQLLAEPTLNPIADPAQEG